MTQREDRQDLPPTTAIIIHGNKPEREDFEDCDSSVLGVGDDDDELLERGERHGRGRG